MDVQLLEVTEFRVALKGMKKYIIRCCIESPEAHICFLAVAVSLSCSKIKRLEPSVSARASKRACSPSCSAYTLHAGHLSSILEPWL